MSDSASQWYYSVGGKLAGPVSATELKRRAAAGEIAGTDQVWKDGMAEWMPAGRVKGLLFPPRPGGPPPLPRAEAVPPPAAWEHTEFRLKIPKPHHWAVKMSLEDGWTAPAVTRYWWDSMQSWIFQELQQWLDEGWEPQTEVGPGGFTPRYFWPYFHPNPTPLSGIIDKVLGIVLFPFGFWSWLTGETGQFMEPTSFVVRLRRRK
jgi:hypothetical protein